MLTAAQRPLINIYNIFKQRNKYTHSLSLNQIVIITQKFPLFPFYLPRGYLYSFFIRNPTFLDYIYNFISWFVNFRKIILTSLWRIQIILFPTIFPQTPGSLIYFDERIINVYVFNTFKNTAHCRAKQFTMISFCFMYYFYFFKIIIIFFYIVCYQHSRWLET